MELSWNRDYHRITPEEKSRNIVHIPYDDQNGVYVISELISAKKIARYVGKGKIAERMSNHKSDTEENDDLKKLMQERPFQYRVDYALISNKDDTSNAEHTLFEHYGGLDKLYNKIIPDGNTVSINPPF